MVEEVQTKSVAVQTSADVLKDSNQPQDIRSNSVVVSDVEEGKTHPLGEQQPAEAKPQRLKCFRGHALGRTRQRVKTLDIHDITDIQARSSTNHKQNNISRNVSPTENCIAGPIPIAKLKEGVFHRSHKPKQFVVEFNKRRNEYDKYSHYRPKENRVGTFPPIYRKPTSLHLAVTPEVKPMTSRRWKRCVPSVTAEPHGHVENDHVDHYGRVSRVNQRHTQLNRDHSKVDIAFQVHLDTKTQKVPPKVQVNICAETNLPTDNGVEKLGTNGVTEINKIQPVQNHTLSDQVKSDVGDEIRDSVKDKLSTKETVPTMSDSGSNHISNHRPASNDNLSNPLKPDEEYETQTPLHKDRYQHGIGANSPQDVQKQSDDASKETRLPEIPPETATLASVTVQNVSVLDDVSETDQSRLVEWLSSVAEARTQANPSEEENDGVD